ncbi:putative acetylcholinesterase [Apostichopus japonicus]|uniref:Carboxylic ester hydrolase n=1 Tax=Stichopus japonicus TaxID=307972 RepID=A0A2G8LDB8_STIJA|nr:putative acetylcholinesterase [Apostichopus japonicus]
MFQYSDIAFGGDPNNISLFGQSAGGASVGHHLIAQQSWDYFHRALLISGNMMSPWGLETDIAKARSDAFLLGRLIGCADGLTSAELVTCLRTKDAKEISAAANGCRSLTGNSSLLILVFYWPTETLKQCSVIVGNTQDDGSIVNIRAFPSQLVPPFLLKPTSDYPTFRDKLETFTYTFVNDVIITAIEQQYIDWTQYENPDSNYFFTFMDIATDEAFHCTSEHTSREYTTNGNTVYRYFFTHLPKTSYWPSAPRWIGVAHAEDLPFVFGYGFSPFREWEFTSDEEQLSLDIMRYFTNFAKTGDPNNSDDNDGNSDPESEWKEFEIPGLVLKEFNPNLNDLTGVRADNCRMWNHNIPSMVDYTDNLSEYEAQWREEITIWKYDDVTKWRLSFNDYQQNSDSCT